MADKSVVLEFDAPSHTYQLEGRRVPSVTQVLDPLLKLDDIPPDVLEAARVFGQHVHEAIHLYNIDDLCMDSLDPRLALYVDGYRKFLTESGFKVELTEERVASMKYRYAGTLDLAGTLGKKRAVIDAKSTASLPRTVGLQTAAYQQALSESAGVMANARYCLHLRPGDYRLVELKNPQDFTYFLSALNLHRWHAAG